MTGEDGENAEVDKKKKKKKKECEEDPTYLILVQKSPCPCRWNLLSGEDALDSCGGREGRRKLRLRILKGF